MRRRGISKAFRITLVAVVVASAWIAPGSEGSALSAFHTPGWIVQCYVVGEEAPAVLICSMPSDGGFVSMEAKGRVRTGVDTRNKGRRDPFAARRLLAFGRYWRFGALFGCVSRSTGLKCWNAGGHGWTLLRDGHKRLF